MHTTELVALAPSALLALLRWVSQALPVGGYAYSRGLEQAVEAGWVRDEASALHWISGVLRRGMARLDAPVMVRALRAWASSDLALVQSWNTYLAASRESRELLLEDEQMGQALLRLLRDLELVERDVWPFEDKLGYVAAFALACHISRIDARTALYGYLWTTAEGQTSAAVRLIPLGQTAGQRVLSALSAVIPNLIESALELPDHELGALLPAQAIASALHETQYTRLFRS